MRLKKLVTLGAAAATLLGVVTSGAATASAAPTKITFTWWTWTTNPKNVIKNFEKAYPNISIPAPPDYGSGGTFYSKLTTAMAGGTGPCVTQVEYDHLPQFLAAHDLVNIAQYVNKYKKDFPAWVWGQVSQNGGVYAMPEDIGPMGLMYQPAVFKSTTWPCRRPGASSPRTRWPSTRRTPTCGSIISPPMTPTCSSPSGGRRARGPTC